jgi:hypothetical protein
MLDRPSNRVDDIRQRTASKATDIAREILFCAKGLAG